jgi:hypothetical protein
MVKNAPSRRTYNCFESVNIIISDRGWVAGLDAGEGCSTAALSRIVLEQRGLCHSYGCTLIQPSGTGLDNKVDSGSLPPVLSYQARLLLSIRRASTE